jgi:hypothetical protein
MHTGRLDSGLVLRFQEIANAALTNRCRDSLHSINLLTEISAQVVGIQPFWGYGMLAA